jgi:hypothetical protein
MKKGFYTDLIVGITLFLLSLSLYARTVQLPDFAERLYIGQIIPIELDLSDIKPERLHVEASRQQNLEFFDIREITDKPWHYLLRIAPFDTGYISTERFVIYAFTHDHADTIYVEPFSFYVHTSLTPADTLLKDIAPPLAFRLMLWDYLFPIVMLLLLVLFIWLVVYLYNRYIKKVGGEVEFVDNRPPWKLAIELLEKFKEKRLLEADKYLEYYFELSMIFRFFIEKQFGIKAMEMTTYEIKVALTDCEEKLKILAILSDMDRVKFARGIPLKSEAVNKLVWIESYILAFSTEPSPKPVNTQPVETGE